MSASTGNRLSLLFEQTDESDAPVSFDTLGYLTALSDAFFVLKGSEHDFAAQAKKLGDLHQLLATTPLYKSKPDSRALSREKLVQAMAFPTTYAELADVALHARVPGGAKVFHWLPTDDSGNSPHATAQEVMRCGIRAALEFLSKQQESVAFTDHGDDPDTVAGELGINPAR